MDEDHHLDDESGSEVRATGVAAIPWPTEDQLNQAALVHRHNGNNSNNSNNGNGNGNHEENLAEDNVMDFALNPSTPSDKNTNSNASPPTIPRSPFSSFSPASPSSRGSSPSPRTRYLSLSSHTVPSGAPLVADVQLARSRLLVTKTHIIHPAVSSLIPFPAVFLGFRTVFHPLSHSKLRDAAISIRFLPPDSNHDQPPPVIKALFPSDDYPAADNGQDQPSDVTTVRENSYGLSLGYDQFGSLHLDRNASTEVSYTTRRTLQSSGVETSHALFTLMENPATHDGIHSNIDFAVLLSLPYSNNITRAFEAEMSVEANVGGDSIGSGLRRMLGSPRVWRLEFDGRTQLGNLKIGGSPNALANTRNTPNRQQRHRSPSPKRITSSTITSSSEDNLNANNNNNNTDNKDLDSIRRERSAPPPPERPQRQ